MNSSIVLGDVLLSAWSFEIRAEHATSALLGDNVTTSDDAVPAFDSDGFGHKDTLMLLYVSASILQAILMITSSIIFIFGSVRASASLHHIVTSRILHAPMHWYDATPSGRIMSRFTTDLNVMDIQLPQETNEFIQMNGVAIATLALVGIVAHPVMTILAPLGIVVYMLVMVISRKSHQEKSRGYPT